MAIAALNHQKAARKGRRSKSSGCGLLPSLIARCSWQKTSPVTLRRVPDCLSVALGTRTRISEGANQLNQAHVRSQTSSKGESGVNFTCAVGDFRGDRRQSVLFGDGGLGLTSNKAYGIGRTGRSRPVFLKALRVALDPAGSDMVVGLKYAPGPSSTEVGRYSFGPKRGISHWKAELAPDTVVPVAEYCESGRGVSE